MAKSKLRQLVRLPWAAGSCPWVGKGEAERVSAGCRWVEKFDKHGLSLEPVSRVFERRPCDAEGRKAVNPTTVDDGWSIADVSA